MAKKSENTITHNQSKDSPAFEQLRAILEDWAIEYQICIHPDRLAIDAADYIHDELLGASEQ